MAGTEPLYRRTEADESWWPEGGYGEFRYTWPWRSWLHNSAAVVGMVLALMSIIGLATSDDLGLGFSFGVFILLFIAGVYAPFFLSFQVLRPFFTYVRAGPRGIEWRDDILGERRIDGYYLCPGRGFHPRRLRWEDVLRVAMPRVTSADRVMSVWHVGAEAPAFITVDGLRDRETLLAAICEQGRMQDLFALPDDRVKRGVMSMGLGPSGEEPDMFGLLALDSITWHGEHLDPDDEAELEAWDTSRIREEYQIVCREEKTLFREAVQ